MIISDITGIKNGNVKEVIEKLNIGVKITHTEENNFFFEQGKIKFNISKEDEFILIKDGIIYKLAKAE